MGTTLAAMFAKTLASLAVIGSAAAYVPMMSMDMGRREVVQAGAAAAAVTPFLQGAPDHHLRPPWLLPRAQGIDRRQGRRPGRRDDGQGRLYQGVRVRG